MKKIAQAYEKFESDDDIARKVTIKDIEKNDFSLSIPLYIQTSKEDVVDVRTVQECYSDWKSAAGRALLYHSMIMEMLGGTKDDDN
ncbi:MAG: N-6 DNA methylase [Lachnospiraceae bacterium]|nr:N-6 DNA methylase [Lachnospiraceae bacterium]